MRADAIALMHFFEELRVVLRVTVCVRELCIQKYMH